MGWITQATANPMTTVDQPNTMASDFESRPEGRGRCGVLIRSTSRSKVVVKTIAELDRKKPSKNPNPANGTGRKASPRRWSAQSPHKCLQRVEAQAGSVKLPWIFVGSYRLMKHLFKSPGEHYFMAHANCNGSIPIHLENYTLPCHARVCNRHPNAPGALPVWLKLFYAPYLSERSFCVAHLYATGFWT